MRIDENYLAITLMSSLLKNSTSTENSFSSIFKEVLNNQMSSLLESETESNYTNSYTNILLDKLPIYYNNSNINFFSQINGNSTINYIPSEKSNWTINQVLTLQGSKNSYEPATGNTLEFIKSNVEKYSEIYGVDKNLIYAIIKQESNFNPDVVSSAGAMGLMQLMDFNCKTYNVTNPLDIEQNIKGGVQHIKEYLDMYDGNIEMALMAYNGGPGTMQRRGVKNASDLYKMPKETQNYVPKVMNYYTNGVNI